MFQFNESDRERLQKKAALRPDFCASLKEKDGYLAHHDLLVQEVSTAQWGQYYNCPDDSAPLIFDFNKPHEHVCPVCGRVMTGEPYDGVWWNRIHLSNEKTAYKLALHYFLTGDRESAAFVRRILLTYARHYPNYVAHGNVPCNNPGKTYAQTLNEAIFFRRLANAYDLLEDFLTEDEKACIRQNLFIPGAEFLMQYRKNQIHNHEVLIDSAIGQLGLILGDEKKISFALYEPYGLLYQLEHATLADDFWFEGSLHYQSYALEAFFSYELFARYTRYSNLDNPHYRNMMKNMYVLLSENDVLPAVNDSRYSGNPVTAEGIYEIGYAVYRDEDILRLLHAMYRHSRRDSLEAFLYGVDELPPVQDVFCDYHNEDGSGLTLLRGPEQRYLLINHSPYGGEHDHFDRLSVNFSAFGKQLAADLGTINYGAYLHYEYFKTTGTHNTVCIDESNQPPACCHVHAYERDADSVFLDTSVDFDEKAPELDSYALTEWDTAIYKGVKMRRKIRSMDDFFLDVFLVDCSGEHRIDLGFHCAGTRITNHDNETPVEQLSTKKPYKSLGDVTRMAHGGILHNTWQDGDACLSLDSAAAGDVIYATGPNRDLATQLSFMIQRVQGKAAVFVNLWEAHKGPRRAELLDVQTGSDILIRVRHTLSTGETLVENYSFSRGL